MFTSPCIVTLLSGTLSSLSVLLVKSAPGTKDSSQCWACLSKPSVCNQRTTVGSQLQVWLRKTIGLMSLKSSFPGHSLDLAVGFFDLLAVCSFIYSGLTFWLGPGIILGQVMWTASLQPVLLVVSAPCVPSKHLVNSSSTLSSRALDKAHRRDTLLGGYAVSQ